MDAIKVAIKVKGEEDSRAHTANCNLPSIYHLNEVLGETVGTCVGALAPRPLEVLARAISLVGESYQPLTPEDRGLGLALLGTARAYASHWEQATESLLEGLRITSPAISPDPSPPQMTDHPVGGNGTSVKGPEKEEAEAQDGPGPGKESPADMEVIVG